MASMSRRLERLEQVIRPVQRDNTKDLDDVLARLAPWWAGWSMLRETMDAAHVERVETILQEELFAVGYFGAAGPLVLSFGTSRLKERDPLAGHVDWMIRRTGLLRDVRYCGPFVLPETVANVYAGNPHAQPLDECLSCGYLLPRDTSRRYGEVRPGVHQGYSVGDPIVYFTSCPLCGGEIEANRGNWTNRRVGEVFVVPPELIEQSHAVWRPIIEEWLNEIAAENAARPPRLIG